jgi:hypothetical protein
LPCSSKASFLGDANFPHSFPDYVKGKRIELYQDLYQRYSRLALSYSTDRPIAIRGLEKRLISVLGTKGGYGVFDIYLGRGLLWQRDQGSLERIDFSNKEKEAQELVPSWSWMAYTGSIRYLNIPGGGVEWDQWGQDIISPWKHATDGVKVSPQLQAIVRDIDVVEPGAQIFLDEPNRTFGRPFKCVIVGSSKTSTQGRYREYYALIVIPVDQGEGNFYERAGVAFLHHHQIVWDNLRTYACIR